ncbi:DNA cytosine methyltransferase [Chamaesiphon polymorphus]|uniref:DNA (cytosine-5-)-methyltransferase n=1 Tax=Chamaesiphon polymorphus CCALA 037 TaxID=2107692 RepID=A0A2T1FL19_9CYAN|nr:DNA cytosine methyltransferase [Chamaesiphon polymorphus]PSB45684.1 modification methylase NmeDIP [Chamaesiphon polymorphus CCALA 037]
MKIFSFFAGIGFLDLGFEMAGFDIAYANEIEPSFLGGYQYSRSQMKLSQPEYGYDLCDADSLLESERVEKLRDLLIDARKDGSLVGFIAGPPCPDFSVGGKNRGGRGENGKLTETYVELICRYQPDFFLFENVKGLWSTAKHRLFYDRMRSRLEQNGYLITDSLINALEYGVPQSRERAISIGFRSDLVPMRSSQELESQFPWDINKLYSIDKIQSYHWAKTDPFGENSSLSCPVGIPVNLTVQYWFEKNDVNHHSNSQHCFTPRAGLSRFLSVLEGDDSKKSYKRLHRWRYSPTACYGNNEVHLHPYQARRISVAEALAIQSLPPEFELPAKMSLTDMFKSIGNGVPFLAAKGIATTINEFLSGSFISNLSATKNLNYHSQTPLLEKQLSLLDLV